MTEDERIKLVATMASNLYGQCDDAVKMAEKMLGRIEKAVAEKTGYEA